MGTISGAEISVMRKDQAWGCLRDRDPGRWLSQCKGPEAAAHLCISRKSKEAGVAAGPGHSGHAVGRKKGEGSIRLGLESRQRTVGISLGLNSCSDVHLLRGLG